MHNNITNFCRYHWTQNLVVNRLVQLGYTDAEIRAAVQHAINLLAKGHSAARAFYASTLEAARLRAEALRPPQLSDANKNLILKNLIEAMKCLNQRPKVRQLFVNNQSPHNSGPTAA